MSALETAPAAAAPAALSERAIWWEVLAVAAFGILPPLSAALVHAGRHLSGTAPAALPYWLDSLDLCLVSAGTSIAVLYVISRSGEPASAFGVGRPRVLDAVFGVMVFIAQSAVGCFHRFLPAASAGSASVHPLPSGEADYLLMVVKHLANGFAEELLARAYLITRLERLLKSSLVALLLSSALFASYHLYYGPAGLAEVFVSGLVFGAGYLLLRRVWPVAIGYMLVNVVIEMAK